MANMPANMTSRHCSGASTLVDEIGKGKIDGQDAKDIRGMIPRSKSQTRRHHEGDNPGGQLCAEQA
jgi:hypothetical protein